MLYSLTLKRESFCILPLKLHSHCQNTYGSVQDNPTGQNLNWSLSLEPYVLILVLFSFFCKCIPNLMSWSFWLMCSVFYVFSGFWWFLFFLRCLRQPSPDPTVFPLITLTCAFPPHSTRNPIPSLG